MRTTRQKHKARAKTQEKRAERRSRRRQVDVSKGERQCPSKLRRLDDGYLCCTFVAGHRGTHRAIYVDGPYWDDKGSPVQGPARSEEP